MTDGKASKNGALSRTPKPKAYTFADTAPAIAEAELAWCGYHPDHNGASNIFPVLAPPAGSGLPAQQLSVAFPSDQIPDPIVFDNPFTKEKSKITLGGIFSRWAGNYSYDRATQNTSSARTAPPSVAFVLRWCSDLTGGLIQVRRYAEWLVAAGVPVRLYCDQDQKPLWWGDLKAEFHGTTDAFKRFREITEEVVIIFSVLDFPWVHLIPNLESKRVLHLCQGVESHHWGETVPRLLSEKPIFHVLHSLPFGRIVVSPHLEEYFRAHYRQATYTIPNGIDLSVFKPGTPREEARVFRVLTVGKPSTFIKGGDTLFQALTIFARAHSGVRVELVIVSGSDFDEAKKQELSSLPFAIRVKTKLDAGQMCAEYQNSDVCINTSLYEGFGLPSIESMACGTPVIQADNGGLDGIVQDGKNCLMVPVCNPQRLADACHRLFSDKNLRGMLITGGLATAQTLSREAQHAALLRQFELILDWQFDRAAVADQIVPNETKILERESVARPKFSVIMPTYNHEKFLTAAIDSIRRQTWEDWELVVTNDGSTDGTKALLESMAKADARIKVINKANGGTASALNSSLSRARGEWICWLSSDDFFEPNALESFAKAIAENPETKFFHGNHYRFVEDENRKEAVFEDVPTHLPSREGQVVSLMRVNFINGITICVAREVFDEIGEFNPAYPIAQDYDMWMRISARFPWHYINTRVSTTRWHSGVCAAYFPEAGIYDSTRSCLDHINEWRFAELFPTLDLTKVDDAARAVIETVKSGLDFGAFMYQAVGAPPALFERLLEWLTTECNGELRKALVNTLIAPVCLQLKDLPLPQAIRDTLNKICDERTPPFEYKPYDAFALMEQTYWNHLSAGRANEAGLIERYLTKVGKKITLPASGVSPHFVS